MRLTATLIVLASMTLCPLPRAAGQSAVEPNGNGLAGEDGHGAGRRSASRGGRDREARVQFLKGEKAFNLGKFAEALAAYEAAYEAKALPALLFNIAQCHRNLDRPERAAFFYRRYLTLEPRSKDRQLVLDLIEEQDRKQEAKAAQAVVAARAAARRSPSPGATTGRAGADGMGADQGDPLATAMSASPAREAEGSPPLYKRWWVWTAAGVAAAGLGAVLLFPRQGPLPMGRLESVDRR